MFPKTPIERTVEEAVLENGKAVKRMAKRTFTADLQTLTETYVGGDWTRTGDLAADLIARVNDACSPPAAGDEKPDQRTDQTTNGQQKPPIDITRDYVHLVWVGRVPAAADDSVFSMLVHEPALPPYSPSRPPSPSGRPTRPDYRRGGLKRSATEPSATSRPPSRPPMGWYSKSPKVCATSKACARNRSS